MDRVDDLEPGKRAVGYKNVTFNEYFFQGHFEQEPVMPGVLIIEALAQVGAIAVLSHEDYKGKMAYFGGINNAKFRRKVVPGDVLKLEVEMIKLKSRAGVGRAVAYVGDEIACEAEIMFITA
ncbi:3-hydroxyacyl-[acyl-carrier-protein] dehydratase FabZ [Thermobrachium celere]|nr:3-hydroxyacyl-[acyl-carrier-protein] dehydratase FabZ [Thermobrachium celere]